MQRRMFRSEILCDMGTMRQFCRSLEKFHLKWYLRSEIEQIINQTGWVMWWSVKQEEREITEHTAASQRVEHFEIQNICGSENSTNRCFQSNIVWSMYMVSFSLDSYFTFSTLFIDCCCSLYVLCVFSDDYLTQLSLSLNWTHLNVNLKLLSAHL